MTRRAWTAAGATAYFLATIELASWIKQSTQGIALTLGDVHFFLLHPARNFALFVTYPSILATAVALVAGAIAILLSGARFDRSRPRVLIGVLMCAIAVVGFMATGRSQASSPHGDAYLTWLSMTEMQRPNSWIGRLNVFFENRDTDATLPPPRPQTHFTETPAVPSFLEAAERPDILMVFEESTFDPTAIARCRFRAPACRFSQVYIIGLIGHSPAATPRLNFRIHRPTGNVEPRSARSGIPFRD